MTPLTPPPSAVGIGLPPTMSTKPPEPAAMYHGATGGAAGPGPAAAGAGGLLHAFPPSRPLPPTDAIYNPSALYAAAAAAQAYIPFGASDSTAAFYPSLVTVSHHLNLTVESAVAVT